jgi:hypothetical protein
MIDPSLFQLISTAAFSCWAKKRPAQPDNASLIQGCSKFISGLEAVAIVRKESLDQRAVFGERKWHDQKFFQGKNNQKRSI